MSGPKRVFLLAMLLLLAATEAVLTLVKGPEACVVIGNQGTEPIGDLQVRYGQNQVEAGPIAPGESARLYVSGRTKGLTLRFRQRGNPVTSYGAPEFEAAAISRDGSELVLNIRPGEVERYQQENASLSWLDRQKLGLWNWLTAGSY